MVVSGFETWPYFYGLFCNGLGVSWPRPILQGSDLIIDESKMEVSGRKAFLAVFGMDLVAIALAQWPSKKWRRLEAIHWLQRDQSSCLNNASNILVWPKNGLLMHVFTFWDEKISLDNNQRQWVVDCVRQPKKAMSNLTCPIWGGKFEFGS